MLTGFQHMHSYMAYIALATLLIAFVMALVNFLGKKEYTNGHRKIYLFAMIAAHIQLLFGLILYIASGRYATIGASMQDSELRLLALEHPLMMLIALVLITIMHKKSKKATNDIAKHRFIVIGYGIALALILSRIPWSQWPN